MENNVGQAMPESIRRWIEASFLPAAVLTGEQRLKGSTSSTLHRVDLQQEGTLRQAVVRRFTNADWLQMEPDLARHEAAALQAAVGCGVPAPRLLAFSEEAVEGSEPAVLMTLLPGEVVLQPEDMERWLHGLAEALAEVHRTAPPTDFAWNYRTYNDLSTLAPQEWSPDLAPEWSSALAIARGPKPKSKTCFIHRDYHPANVLWKDGAVSGIVDWVNACIGPAGIDTGHCRVNLAMMYGTETADRFLEAYCEAAGAAFSYEPYWDLLALFDMLDGPPTVYSGWPAFGFTGLTDQLMRQRIERYMLSLLERAKI